MIESAERLFSSKEKLKDLETEGRYVFHGSDNQNIDEFEPRQSYNHNNDGTKEKDGDPAVFASDRADYAIFMALINKKNCPKGFKSAAASRISNGEVSLTLKATQSTLDQLDDSAEGYVYVFDKSLFEQRPRKTEFISTVPVNYIEKIKVTKIDLPSNIEIIE